MPARIMMHITVLAASLLLWCAAAAANERPAVEAPAFTLPGDNKTISLKDYRGSVVYVDFWASWCPPCLQAFPWMNEMQQRYADRGFRIIAISLDSERDDARAFIEQMQPVFDIAYDPDARVAQQFKVKAMPSSYLIDEDGRIVYSHTGFKQGDNVAIQARVFELLGD